MKYITLKLTEDQARISSLVLFNESLKKDEWTKEGAAYLYRLGVKIEKALAKAKISSDS